MDKKIFLLLWFSGTLEKLVRLSSHIDQLSASAPKIQGQIPAALQELKEQAGCQIGEIHKNIRQLSKKKHVAERQMIGLYFKCGEESRRFVSLHGRLAHFPRDWAKTEIELFIDSLDERLGPAARSTISSARSISDYFTITTSAKYSFANVLDVSNDVAASAEKYDGTETRDIIKIPAVEQTNTTLWPLVAHEIGHTLFRQSDLLGTDSVHQLLSRQSGTTKRILAGSWLEEIFCDLFATSLVGPMYLISMTLFSSFWSHAPVNLATRTHPSFADRYRYISEYLNRSCSTDLKPLFEGLAAFISARQELDYQIRTSEFHDRLESIDRGEFPNQDAAATLAESVSQSTFFHEMARPPLSFDEEKIEALSRRLSSGEFISATSATIPDSELTHDAISGSFDEFKQRLVQTPNQFLDILYASILNHSGLSINHRQNCDASTGFVPHLFIYKLFSEIFDVDYPNNQALIDRAAEFIFKSDGTVVRSLEVSSIHRFYQEYKEVHLK